MKRTTLILFLFLTTRIVSGATFDEANQAYKEGNYALAIELYETLSADGPNSDIHYNLGNSYYKTGDVARAILHYEKSLKLAPNDEDAQHNLKMANLMVVDKIEATPEFFLLTWWKQMALKSRADGWTITFLALLWLSISLFLAFAFLQAGGKKLLFFSGFGTFTIALLMLSLAITRHHYDTDKSQAVIVASSVSVKSAPVHSGTDLFIIHEGLKVKVLDTEKDWLEIELADGKEGWVAASTLEVI